MLQTFNDPLTLAAALEIFETLRAHTLSLSKWHHVLYLGYKRTNPEVEAVVSEATLLFSYICVFFILGKPVMIVIEFMENGALDAFLRVSSKIILPF